jgi:hypothetical protein
MSVWGWPTALLFGMFFIFLAVLLEVGLGGLSPRISATRTEPNEGIKRSIRNALMVALPTASLFGLGTGAVFGAKLGEVFGLLDGATAFVVIFVAVGLRAGGRAWLQHYALRLVMSARNLAPLHAVRFLNYATDCILLRRFGGGYMFIHRTVLEYFSDRDGARAELPTPPVR